jgi:hypothetical protein
MPYFGAMASSFLDVEAFLLPAMDVRGWLAARRHDGFPHGVLAVCVFE